MCGITGILNIDGKPVPEGVLKKMTEVVRHRGPDGEGTWIDSNVGFGHRRLAILDLTTSGSQPMKNDEGNLVITYNGEVYNFMELRKELEALGYGFRSSSDTEVVLKSYEEWGPACVRKFNGMFAFAIWDCRRKVLFIARDRYGIKPLYYYFRDNTFLFGSEIKSILEYPSVSVRVSLRALNEYFTFQNLFSDLTLFSGIKLLPSASTLTIDMGEGGAPREERYWDFEFTNEDGMDEREYVEELIRLINQSVNRQAVSDVEVGAYLSGGMDSGTITCVAARRFENIKTFTAGFDLSSASGLELGFDEREKAEYLSNLYKTEHYEVVLKAGDMERVIAKLIWNLEDLRVGQSYPNYYVSRLASKFVKVVLSGIGGDELFAGYPWRYYRAVRNANSDGYVEKYYKYWQRLIPDSLKSNFFAPDVYSKVRDHSTVDVFRSVMNLNEFNGRTSEEYVNLSLYFEIKTFLHGLLEVEDKLSMAHGLETRVPFLDNDLVDFAMKLPVKHKLRDLDKVVDFNENEPGQKVNKYFQRTNEGKILARKAMARFVPESYTTGVKQGFSAPDGSWFKGESIDYIKGLLFDKNARIYEYIKHETATGLMREHFTGENNRRLLIWSLVCFEWWLKTFMGKA